MININLLPYRPARRQKMVQLIIAGWAASAVLGVLISFGVDLFMTSIIEERQATKAQNTERIKQLDSQLGELKKLEEIKAALQKRIDVVAQLSKNRDLPERILTEFSHTIPGKIWLNHMEVKPDRIQFKGLSESNSDIAEFMINLGKSPYFTNVELGRSTDELIQGISLKSFEMSLSVKPPS